MDGAKTRTSSGETLSRTAPLKPKPGLSGPPVMKAYHALAGQSPPPKLENAPSVQKVRSIQRVPLHRPEPGVANDAAKFFFGRAVGHAGGADDVFFKHD